MHIKRRGVIPLWVPALEVPGAQRRGLSKYGPRADFAKYRKQQFFNERNCCSKCVHLMSQYCFCYTNKLNVETEQVGTRPATHVSFWLPSLFQNVSYWLLLLLQNVSVEIKLMKSSVASLATFSLTLATFLLPMRLFFVKGN